MLFNDFKKWVVMRNSLSLWFMALAVFGSVSVAGVSDARSESFWERYFGSKEDEQTAKPKHVFLQPENGRSSGPSIDSSQSSKTNIKEVHKKLQEVDKKGANQASSGQSDQAKLMQMNVDRAQSASKAYELAQAELKKFDGKKYLDMSAKEQREYNDAVKKLQAAELDLNSYMNNIETMRTKP